MIDKVSLAPLQMVKTAPTNDMSASVVTDQFSRYLNGAISDLNTQQAAVDKLNTQFVKGEISDVHQLMIASEKASLGLELTVQVRNKVIEAYQEIMRMQV
ncbi:flagellar hook-basal body complex protein FliE [Paenibacillus sp. UNCCL117]|uniref:flagellar hook-basal body complex protein FliE n=1 Tax=unclassified Paenibacillus TaxID=185978 RepID=UPI000882F267|nr:MULTISPECIES: flagellar hook-basal body complex protein FliE [unclassified Paenibacillus]SDC86032.1 flagellar hook-basal body complex protein FliE [Paenibacillus sp. cl123]SFW27711.1 flagellar hook-basal body complex protein FliE [Paenibacillus sp. UNCCL117]